jgi:NADH-quinone oxidoreductase subunit L
MRRVSPLVFWTFLAGAACLAGVPFTGGFFSKDAILLAGLSNGSALSTALMGVAVLTALLTATYTFRLVILVFFGKERAPVHAHALPAIMRWTLPPLAASGLVADAMNLPPVLGGSERLDHWLHAGRFAGEALPPPSLTVGLALAATTAVLVALGWWLAHRRYARLEVGPGPGRFLLQGWKADGLVSWLVVRPFGALARFFWKGIDGAVIDGGLDGAARGIWAGGERVRRLTTGRVSSYLTAMVLGLVAVLVYFLARWSLTG